MCSPNSGSQHCSKAMYDLICLLCIAFMQLCCDAEHTLRSSALIQSCANCCPETRASLLRSQLSWLCVNACECTFASHYWHLRHRTSLCPNLCSKLGTSDAVSHLLCKTISHHGIWCHRVNSNLIFPVCHHIDVCHG